MNIAWIIGNGPSLNQTPLHLLKDEDTFAVNHIYKIFPHTDWRPKYYVRTDDWDADLIYGEIFQDITGEITDVLEAGAYAFLGKFFYQPMAKTKYGGMIQMVSPICGEQQWHIRDGGRNVPRSWHFSSRGRLREYCSFGGSLSVAIQLVCFGMGKRATYDAIYLIGCDLGYKDGAVNHFADDYYECVTELTPAEIVEEDKIYAHEIAKKCSPIPIFNATIGGELEVYPRVDIWEELGS